MTTPTTAELIAQGIADSAPLVSTVVQALGDALGYGPAVALGLKIASGVAAKAPQAVVLAEQFLSGSTPSQVELDAYAHDELGAYDKLMADIKAKSLTAT